MLLRLKNCRMRQACFGALKVGNKGLWSSASPFCARHYHKSLNVHNSTSLAVFGNVLGGDEIKPVALATFKAWHQAVGMSFHNTNDTATMIKEPASLEQISEIFGHHIDENITFHPLLILIHAVSEVFGSSFQYGRQWISPDGLDWALEFSASIEGDITKSIDGIDLVKLNEAGKIVEFKVLARPPNGVTALKAAMMRKVPSRMMQLKAQQTLKSILGG